MKAGSGSGSRNVIQNVVTVSGAVNAG